MQIRIKQLNENQKKVHTLENALELGLVKINENQIDTVSPSIIVELSTDIYDKEGKLLFDGDNVLYNGKKYTVTRDLWHGFYLKNSDNEIQVPLLSIFDNDAHLDNVLILN